MPCQDYRDDYSHDQSILIDELREQNNKLARIACKALTELEDNNISTMLLLRDDEVAKWWGAHKKADAIAAENKKIREQQKAEAAEKKRQKAARAQLKAELIARLTLEERELLGVK